MAQGSRHTADWFKIAENFDEIKLAANGITTLDVKDRKICISKYRDEWFAFHFKCPHASGMLAEGYIDAIGNVVCPVHQYRYNLRNGKNPEGYYLKVYPVELRPEGVFVGL